MRTYEFCPGALRAIRTESSLSQTDVVRMSGVSQAMLSNYENGKSAPSVASALSLAEAYGFDFDDFVRRVFRPVAEEGEVSDVVA